MKVIENTRRLIWAVCFTSKAGKGWIRAYDDEQTARDDVAQLMENPPPGRSYAVEIVPLYDQASPVPSLRDDFATAALQGLISQSHQTALWSDKDSGAQYAYEMADAMLRARKVPA